MKRPNLRYRLVSAILLGLLTMSMQAELPPLIPLEDFFRNPAEVGHSLSPSGEYIACLKPWRSRLNLFVREVESGREKRVTSVETRDIASFDWVSDDFLAYTLDQGGDENFHVFLARRDGSETKDLTPFPETRAAILDPLPRDPRHFLIQHNRRDKRVFDAYRVDLKTGETQLVVENPGVITGYMADHEGRVRAAVSADGVQTSLLFRESEEEDFRTVLTTDFRDTLAPLAFTFDNQFLYCASNLGRDRQAIVVFDPRKAQETRVIYEHPQVDTGEILLSEKRKKLTGAAFLAAKRGYKFFDEERRRLQERLEAKLPGVEVVVVSANLNEDRFIVRTYSDKTRGAVYLYDAGKNRLACLAEISPWLNPEHMADVRPIVYQSRDGLLILGYLTLPKGVPPRRLPTVILPHGGPWARDAWGFDPVLQMLANRGYAVLQMNFRGSTGFGRKFWELSFKQWGLAMQNDVTDGVRWLIEQGVADPKRVGIFGGSYGGYVVLAGLTFTPDLYACGVDYVGVANLFTLMETIPPYWEPMRRMMYEMIGDPEKDAELFRRVSPVFHADRIKAPLLIVQGANDPRVKKAESDQMVEALRQRGVETPYLVKDNEGHGFHNEENRFEVYRALEQFFARRLGGRVGSGKDILGKLEKTAAPSAKR